MKIGILQTGRTPEEMREQHGDYDDLFKRFLAGRGFHFVTYKVLDNVFPEDIHAADGWLITGSKFGTYEDHEWIPPLERFLRRAYAAGVPIVGVCFGHQVLAQALGGRVEKYSGGWAVGPTDYDTDRPSGGDRIIAWHQDQVTEVPEGAEVVGSSDFCRYAALAYGDRAFTIQPHPEFTSAFLLDLIEARRDILPKDVQRTAEERAKLPLTAPEMADRFEEFFKRKRPTAKPCRRFWSRKWNALQRWISLQNQEIPINIRDSAVGKGLSQMPIQKKLIGLTEIFRFLRSNKTPIYIVTPTPYSLLGLDQWVGSLTYVNYFDIFDGAHRRVFCPHTADAPEFQSMEDVANYLVSHEEFRALVESKRAGKAIVVMFNEETERLCAEMGLEIALPKAELRTRLDSKIETTRLGNEAGVASAPNVLGEANTYDELMALADGASLGRDLVVQTPYGDSGRTTFFISCEEDWRRYEGNIVDQQLKVMKRLNHLPGTIEGVATRVGTFVGPVMTDITGFDEVTPYKGGWCGNDMSPTILPDGVPEKVRDMTRKFGDRLYQEGYKGVFCVDFLLDTDTNEVYLGELNPRVSGATPPSFLITATYGGCPSFLFHLLEYLDVEYDVDVDEIQARWNDYDHWTQLIMKQTKDEVGLITRAPQSGIWRLNEENKVEFVRPALNVTSIGDEDEAFYLRVYGVGEYSYLGADLGCLLARGRMQSDGRELLERAKNWNAGMKALFATVPINPSEYPEIPEDMSEGKWF